jgi:hypothetical protein
MWSKNRSGSSLGTEKIIMVEFFRSFASPSPPRTHSFSYHKEGTHLCQWEASVGFNYLFSINSYGSGEPHNPIMNMAAVPTDLTVWVVSTRSVTTGWVNPVPQALRQTFQSYSSLFDHRLPWNILTLCSLLWMSLLYKYVCRSQQFYTSNK